jgi:23S rRNA U2552 (ribose-2'-O)-methylase RlmE/FtsJ
MEPLEGVHFLQGSIADSVIHQQIENLLQQSQKSHFNLVLSDMGHNFTGNRSVDSARVLVSLIKVDF